MKRLRKLLYQILGIKAYLRLISKIYITLIRWGFYKNKYQELHYLKKIIKPGYVCLDIGANLGYYSFFMCTYAGKEGKVFAVEPVPLFRQIFEKNVPGNKFPQLTMFPYALGESEQTIAMGMPIVDGVIHHGMTHVLSKDETSGKPIAETFDVTMKVPDRLLENLERLDFIKCDVEGYEYVVLSNMLNTINKHRPIIQCELSNQNKVHTINLLKQIGYETYILRNDELIKQSTEELLKITQDVYFVPMKNT
jgi:FkbM family methyltransferase